jgi:hypothetical protein
MIGFGLVVYREFGPAADPGMVFFLGQGLLEISGRSDGVPGGHSPFGCRSGTSEPRGAVDRRRVTVVRPPRVEP